MHGAFINLYVNQTLCVEAHGNMTKVSQKELLRKLSHFPEMLCGLNA